MRITSPVTRSQKQPSNWNPRPCFPYSLCNFYGAVSTAIKDRLQRLCLSSFFLNIYVNNIRHLLWTETRANNSTMRMSTMCMSLFCIFVIPPNLEITAHFLSDPYHGSRDTCWVLSITWSVRMVRKITLHLESATLICPFTVTNLMQLRRPLRVIHRRTCWTL